MKRCPFCSKEIKDEAIKCKHCRKWLKKEDLPQISFIGNAVFNYIEFYYSTKHTPVDRYKCNNEHVLRLLKCLESKRIETAAIDLADNPDPFRQYIKASTGPNSEYHPIFGEVQGRTIRNISARPSLPSVVTRILATGHRWKSFPAWI